MFWNTQPVKDENFLRFASPNERRCIVRESLDFYRALVVGGIYELSSKRDITCPATYTHALRKCIEQHPFLATLTKQGHTEKSYFGFSPEIDLKQHIHIKPSLIDAQDERTEIELILPDILDRPWTSLIPSWEIVVVPISRSRCFIAFSYSHGWSDGMCGIAFHRTFLRGMQENRIDNDFMVRPKRKCIADAIDIPGRLPITWSYMLSPLLGAYLPTSVASLFGFKATTSETREGTWTGAKVFVPEEYQTKVHLFSIDEMTLAKVLSACRKNSAKLTGLLHQLIINALAANLPSNIDSLGSGTAINMRNTINVSQDTMGMFVTGDYDFHHVDNRTSSPSQETIWGNAREKTEKLAARAKDLVDQPIGLLRYLTNMRGWFVSKVGQPRESSYEISNLLSFKPIEEGNRECKIEDMVFCQPMNVYGPPLVFNVVSVQDGPLNVVVSWQPGALGLDSVDEKDFVREVCESVREGFKICVGN